ncbi:MAG: Wzz/FepE/Etk N-terminal domain-containing protein, partial [Anaerolineales bacterium]
MASSTEYTIDDYWSLIYRRRGIIILTVVLAGVFSGVISGKIPPSYEARAQFYVPQDVVLARGGPDEGGIRVPGLKEQARAQVAILEARDASQSVADQFPDK